MASDTLRKSRWRLLRTAAIAFGAMAGLLLAASVWLLGTQSGARSAFSLLSTLSNGAIQAEGVHGRLAHSLRIEKLALDSPERNVSLTNLRIDWQPAALLQRRLHVSSVQASNLSFHSKIVEDKQEPPRLPDTIALPLLLHIDQARLDGGEIRIGPLALIKLGSLGFKLKFDGSDYHFELDQMALQSTQQAGTLAGNLKGQGTLSTVKPYAIDAGFTSNAEATVEQRQFDAAGDLTLSGSLAEMNIGADLGINKTRVNGHALLRPFTSQPLGGADLAIHSLDLTLLNPGLPHTELDIRLLAGQDGDGTLTVSNAAAGLYNDGRLPLTSLDIRFQHDSSRLVLRQVEARAGSKRQPAGTITGSGHWMNGGLTLALRTPQLNLQRIDQRVRATQLAGEVDIHSGSGRQEISLALTEPLKRNNKLALSARLVVSGGRVTVQQAELAVDEGRATATGHLDLAGSQSFAAQGQIRQLRIADVVSTEGLPELTLNGSFSLAGRRGAQPEGKLEFELNDSLIAGHLLQGDGKALLRADSIAVPRLVLTAGVNRLALQGELSRSQSRLDFTLAAPQLEQLGPGLSGALHLEGAASGRFATPHLAAEWKAEELTLPNGLHLQLLQGQAEAQLDRKQPYLLRALTAEASSTGIKSGQLQLATLTAKIQFSPQESAPLLVDIGASNAAFGELRADTLSLKADGTTGHHQVEAGWKKTGQDWLLHAEGGLQDLQTQLRWQGSIAQLQARGHFNAQLAGSAPLTVSRQLLDLRQFRLDSDMALITVEHFRRDAEGVDTRGQVDRMQLGQLLKFAGPAPVVSTDLQLDGAWNLRAGKTIQGSVELRRREGDIVMLGRIPTALGLRTLQAQVDAENGQLQMQLRAEGEQLGRIEVQANTAGDHGRLGIGPHTPVSGSANLDIPAIGWIAPLISPGLVTEGRLQSNVAIAGTLDNPALAGQISGDGLRLYFTDTGVDLRQGTLVSRFNDSRLLVEALRFENGGGTLLVSGPIRFTSGRPEVQLSLAAQRYLLLNRTDRKLTVSGATQITMGEERGRVSGDFTVDSGFFDIGRDDTPQLSDDVVIVGREEKPAGRFPLALDLTIRFGNGVQVQGRGLDALLVGQIRLHNPAGGLLQAHGSLSVAKGTYAAYGRELAIEQGVLRFAGPLNNPGLNILAMRRRQEVAAGVSVHGTVLAPRVTLVSEPQVPDAEKLSWLVLGHGLSGVAGDDLAVLQAAAGALLGGSESAGIQSQIAGAFGLDTLSVSTSQDTLQERIVTVGKQISSRLFISYRQGLESATGVLQLRYTLSRKLTLEAEAGARSALSLFYNITFD